MGTDTWIHLGLLIVAGMSSIAGAAWAVIRVIGKILGERFDNVDTQFDKVTFQFSKVDLKFDDVSRQFNERFGQVVTQIERLRDLGNDRHVANIERLARLEGQISALPQKIDPNQNRS